jgi:hypothetical protein
MGNTRRIRAQTHYSLRATQDRGPFCLNERRPGGGIASRWNAARGKHLRFLGRLQRDELEMDICRKARARALPSFLLRPSFRAAKRRAEGIDAFASKSINSRRRRADSRLASLAGMFLSPARIRMTERNALRPRVCGACRGVRGATPHKSRYAKIPPPLPPNPLSRTPDSSPARAKRPGVSLIFIQNTLLSEVTGCRLRDAPPIRRGALFYSL